MKKITNINKSQIKKIKKTKKIKKPMKIRKTMKMAKDKI